MPVDRTTYNTLADDSGFNLDGTPVTKAVLDGLLDGVDVAIAGLTSDGTDMVGVKFTTTGSSNDQTLDAYKEGTWTPTDASGASLSLTLGTCQFVKVGQRVDASADITFPTTASGLSVVIGGLPFTSQSVVCWGGHISYTDETTLKQLLVVSAGTTVTLRDQTGSQVTNATMSTNRVIFTAIYRASA